MVGGIQRRTVRARDGRFLCPTYGRNCDGKDNSFKCGSIYSNVCIDREPISSISQRCFDRSKAINPNLAQFSIIREESTKIYQRVCIDSGQKRDKEICRQFRDRLSSLAVLDQPGPPTQAAISPPTPDPPAAIPEVSTNPEAPSVPSVASQSEPPARPSPSESPSPSIQAVTEPPRPLPSPPSPVTPPTSDTPKNCTKAFAVLVEGTNQVSPGSEASFYREVADYAHALSEFSSGTHIIPPAPAVQKVKAENKTETSDLLTRARLSDNICTFEDEIFDFMMGNYNQEVRVESYNFNRYRQISAKNGHAQFEGAGLGPEAQVEFVDVQREALTSDNSPVLKQLADLKEQCGEETDAVVNISVIDHGSKDCRIWLDRNRGMTPEMVYDNLVKPFEKMGIKVHLNLSSCYSGCFTRLKNQLSSNTCLTTSTRANTVGYGTDGLIGSTYDTTYPYFLKKMKNPMKAHICASALDVMNEPQMVAARTRSIAPVEKPELDSAAFRKVAKDLGYPDIADRCKSSMGEDFPQSAISGLPTNKIKQLAKCESFMNKLGAALTIREAQIFMGLIAQEDSWPGLDGLRGLAGSRELQNIKDACDYDLSRYSKDSTPRSSGTRTKNSGRK